jgi:hypothetical protein
VRPHAILVFIGLIAGAAHADAPKKSSLSWVRLDGAESCVATQPLARAVEQRLGRSVFVSASEAELSVEGRVEKKKSWRAHVEVRDAQGKLLGKRDLESTAASCDSLTAPLALVLAVMIDPDAALGGGTKADPTPPPNTSGGNDPGSVIIIREPAPKPKPKKELWRLETNAGFVVAPGLLPGLGFGLEASSLLTTPLAPIAGMADVVYLFENERTTIDTSIRISHVRGALGICPLQLEAGAWSGSDRKDRFVGSLCAGGGLGVLLSRTIGPLADGRTQANITLDLALGARASVRLFGPIIGGLQTQLLVPILRDKIGGIYQQGPIAGLGTLFLGVRIP